MNNCSLKGQPSLRTVVLASVLGLLATGAGATTLADIYAAADRIRDNLADLGIVLEDTRNGTTWVRR